MKKTFTRKEHTESAMALVLILLIAAIWKRSFLPVEIAAALLLLAMIAPPLFYPFSFFWLNLSHFLGRISSFVLLALIFILVVTPTGIFRKLIGKDRLLLRQFKKSPDSVFHRRDHTFIKDDILHPF